MTKSQSIKAITAEYLSTLTVTSADDIEKISEELLTKTHEAFDEHNVICNKDEKWKKNDGLTVAQIADVLNNVFTFRRICCSGENNDESYDILGVYVDNILVDYMNDYRNRLGTYITSEDVFEIIISKFVYGIDTGDIFEVVKTLRRIATRVYRCDEIDLIAVANGIFNYKTKELMDFSCDKVFLTKSQVKYNHAAQNVFITMPDGTDWDVESWMATLAPEEPELVNLFWQIIGAIIRPNVRWNKAAFLVSEKGCNGKGTLCELMRSICGKGSYTSIPLADFGKEFRLEPLIRASAIIVDENDVGGGFLDKAGDLKAVITNDVIQINRKFKVPVTFQFKGFMVQCLNEVIRTKDKSDSFLRRQIYIPMKANFAGSDERTYIKEDYIHRQDVLEYVLKKVLEMDYYKFDIPACCEEALEDFKQMNNPVYDFWVEFRDLFVWDLLPFSFLYALYKKWFGDTKPSGAVVSDKTFIRELLNIVDADADWCCEDKTKQISSSKGNMGNPELLIARYHLTEWMAPHYKGADPAKISMPALATKYRGIQRVTSSVTEEDEEQ